MRLFVALDIDEGIRTKISRFIEDVRGFASDIRWVQAESLHVTLKFIGERQDVDAIKAVLSRIQAVPIDMTIQGFGFFPTAKSARVFWIGIEAGSTLSSLAKTVDENLFTLGITRETHAFSPHLTLARSGSGQPSRGKEDRNNRKFKRLQEKLGALPVPEFGTMTAREFYLYQSQLSRKG